MNNEQIIRHYDALIENGNDPFLDGPELREYMDKWDGSVFIDLLRLDKSKVCLEIGVGTGRLAARTAPLCKTLYGIDISPKTVERAKYNLENSDNIIILCGDFIEFDFDLKFDVIYSSLTFMHFKNKANVLCKIKNLLSSDGRFVLSTDKNQSTVIDAGFSKIKIYPDNYESILENAQNSGFSLKNHIKTEFAHIYEFVT